MEFEKFVNLPVIKLGKRVVEENIDGIVDYINDNGGKAKSVKSSKEQDRHIVIETLEGSMRADIGTVVMQGTENEFWAVQSDIFEETYRKYDPEEDDHE